ncbi:MAG: VanZ family protein [Patescibacteria group bacterium]|nr:VanZ family protein [Patescibacteria group bacterium]
MIGRVDKVCRFGQGYGFGYYLKPADQKMLYQRYGWERIKYNLRNFFQFWFQPPLGKKFSNLKEFLVLDVPPSNLIFNILHFFAFLIFTLLLVYLLRLSIGLAFLIGLFFNFFHEYVAEGICLDPSFNDLWTNTLGLLVGMLLSAIVTKKKNKFL